MKDVGVAVIGAGQWGRNHVRVWSELGYLRAVCDTDPARLSSAAHVHPDITAYARVDELLLRDDIEVLVVASPAATHFSLTMKALAAGKHVLVEKPLALTVDDAEKLRDAARRAGTVVAVGHVLEYHAAVVKLRELIAEGALGELRYLYSNRLNLGTVRLEENALWSFAPHDVALILRILGMLPEDVSCRGGAYLRADVADVTLMSMSFRNGVMAHVFVSWLHPFKVHRFVVVGSQQMAEFDDTAPWDKKLRLFPHTFDRAEGQAPIAVRADAVDVKLTPREPLRAECEHFLACVRNQTDPLTNLISGIDVLRVLEAGQASLSSAGKSVILA